MVSLLLETDGISPGYQRQERMEMEGRVTQCAANHYGMVGDEVDQFRGWKSLNSSLRLVHPPTHYKEFSLSIHPVLGILG